VIRFENPQAKSPLTDGVNLAERQRGVAGEITASRRLRVFARPVAEALHLTGEGKGRPSRRQTAFISNGSARPTVAS
jgi:hypothetical protein